MNLSKLINNINLLISALLLSTVLAGIGIASMSPQPPPVIQKTGLYDTSIDFLVTNSTDQSACRSCHQTSETSNSGGYKNTIGGVPTRHHNLLYEGVINTYTGTKFGCTDCHPLTTKGIVLDRSCIDCHNGTSFYANNIGAHVGNFSRPHHVDTAYDDANIGQPAQNRTCNFCHGSFVDNFNDGHYKPSYSTIFNVTPYATFKLTNFSQPDGLGGNKTWGGCLSCHLPNPAAKPVIGSNHDNHHKEILGFAQFGGKTSFQNLSTPFIGVNNICSICHVIDYTNSTGYGNTFPLRITITNPSTGEVLTNAMEVRNSTIEQADAAIGAFEPGTTNIAINGSGCEKCHNVESLHNIQVNYSGTNRSGYGHIGNGTDCAGCHSGWLPASNTVYGDLIPNVDSVSPSVIIAGTAPTLSITGSNFGNDTAYAVIIDGATYTPTSITDSNIVVNITTLSRGIHKLQLVHNGRLSKLSTLTVVPNSHITSANIRAGVIIITGTGFGVKPAVNPQYYVSVNHSGNQIFSTNINSWSDSQIKAKNVVATIGDIVTVITANSGETTAIITK